MGVVASGGGDGGGGLPAGRALVGLAARALVQSQELLVHSLLELERLTQRAHARVPRGHRRCLCSVHVHVNVNGTNCNLEHNELE